MINKLTHHLNRNNVSQIGQLLRAGGRDAGRVLRQLTLSTANNINIQVALLTGRMEKQIDITQSPEGRKMLAKVYYTFNDPLLNKARDQAEALYGLYNRTGARQQKARDQILKRLFGDVGQGVSIRPPFHCDYGSNIYLGDHVDINFGCVILDCGKVKIGDQTLISPNVQIYTVGHPTRDPKKRATGVEKALPITIGKNVWIGGGAILLRGITIGDNTVIAAGSVVKKNIDPNVLAAGNPCEVVEEIKDKV